MSSDNALQKPSGVSSSSEVCHNSTAAGTNFSGVLGSEKEPMAPKVSELDAAARITGNEATSCDTSLSGDATSQENVAAPSPNKKKSTIFPGFDSTPLVSPKIRSEGSDTTPASGLSPQPSGPARPAGQSRTPPPQRDKLSGLTRCFNPPKLERKHSSGDLQSRLKTRKILGVGETDNGDIHRSKISQVLGHNEHLYVRLPRGLWATHVALALLVTLECALLLLAPSAAGALGLVPIGAPECPHTALRLVGAALSGLAVFVWTAVGTTDKQCARTALVATVLYNALAVAIAVATSVMQGESWRGAVTPITASRVLVCVLCLAYFRQIVGYQPIRGYRNAFASRPAGRSCAKEQ